MFIVIASINAGPKTNALFFVYFLLGFLIDWSHFLLPETTVNTFNYVATLTAYSIAGTLMWPLVVGIYTWTCCCDPYRSPDTEALENRRGRTFRTRSCRGDAGGRGRTVHSAGELFSNYLPESGWLQIFFALPWLGRTDKNVKNKKKIIPEIRGEK